MKIIVTGSRGYLGKYLCEQFVKASHEVIPIDLKTDTADQDHTIIADFADKKVMTPILKRADALIHLAAISGVSSAAANPKKCIEVNINKLKVLLETITKCRPQIKIFFISTYDIIDNAINKKVEKNAVTSLYQYSKYQGESICKVFSKECDLSIKIIRPSTLFGIKTFESNRVLDIFVKSALVNQQIFVHEPKKVLTFTSVKDVYRAIDLNLQNLVPRNIFCEPSNLVSPEEYTLLELAELVKSKLHSQSEIIYKPANNLSLKEKVEPDQQKVVFTKNRTLLVDWLEQVNISSGNLQFLSNAK